MHDDDHAAPADRGARRDRGARADRGVELTLGREVARKAIHLASAAVPVGYALGAPRARVLGGLVALLVMALAVEVARRLVPAVRRQFTRATGALLRAHEHQALSGATWMVLSYTLVTWLAPAPAAIAAMWAVAVGDAAAAVVGRAFGGRVFTWRGASKSLEGAAACLVATVVGAAFVAQAGPAASLAAGVAATVAEWPSRFGDDNLRVAASVALAVVAADALLAVA